MTYQLGQWLAVLDRHGKPLAVGVVCETIDSPWWPVTIDCGAGRCSGGRMVPLTPTLLRQHLRRMNRMENHGPYEIRHLAWIGEQEPLRAMLGKRRAALPFAESTP